MEDVSVKENMSGTINIIAVVTVFLVCQTPDFVQVVIGYAPLGIAKSILYHTSSASLCFLALNSGVNFIIYCFFYKKFRKIAAGMMGCKTWPKSKGNGESRSGEVPVKTNLSSV